MYTLWRDLQYAVRMLGKNPGFTAVAVLTLAMAIAGRQQIAEIPQRALGQRQQFVVPIDVQVIFVLALESRQNGSAFIHLDGAPTYPYLDNIFMVRLWFAEP